MTARHMRRRAWIWLVIAIVLAFVDGTAAVVGAIAISTVFMVGAEILDAVTKGGES